MTSYMHERHLYIYYKGAINCRSFVDATFATLATLMTETARQSAATVSKADLTTWDQQYDQLICV
eukprot:SAG11_NODE_8651_length_991_cov_0.928251_1_plen_65_part_00